MTDKPSSAANILPRMDVETGLYILIFALALVLRLVDLDARLLNTAEAEQALAALRLVQGQPAAEVGSPLLLHATAVLFFLFKPDDFIARLFPALFGAAIVLLPLLWRQYLGRSGALLASLLLALSPLSLFYSRYAGPQILAVGCGLVLLTAIVRCAESGEARYLYLSAASLALLLASGPGAYFLVLILGAAAVAAGLLSRGSENGPAGRFGAALRENASRLGAAGLVFLGTALLVATLALFHVSGLRGFGDVLTGWLRGFVGSSNLPWFASLLWPLLYEPLAVIFGIAGGIRALRERDVLGSLLLGWALGIAVMLMAWGARTAGDFLLTTVPLTLLAAGEIARLLQRARAEWQAGRDGAILAVLCVLWIYVYLQVAGLADRGLSNFAVLAWIGVGMMAVLVVGSTALHGLGSAFRTFGLSVLFAASLFTLSTAFAASFNASGKGAELLDPLPTSPAIHRLVADLSALSLRETGDERELPVTVLAEEPAALAWYLRDMRRLGVFAGMGPVVDTKAVVAQESLQPSFESAYFGQAYTLREDRRWRRVSAQDWWRWVLFRQWPAPAYDRVVLWVESASAPNP